MELYPPSEMREGVNDNGEEAVFYISNPGHGLWAVRERLMQEGGDTGLPSLDIAEGKENEGALDQATVAAAVEEGEEAKGQPP